MARSYYDNMGALNQSRLQERLESFGFYKIVLQLFGDFRIDSKLLGKDYRGLEPVKQQVRSLDSVGANIEEGFGRGFSKELPHHLRIARCETKESQGRYARCNHLLPADLLNQRITTLNHIIGGLTNTINTIEAKQTNTHNAIVPHRPPSVTRHPSPVNLK